MEIPLIHSLCIVYGCNSFCVWISNTLHTQTTFPWIGRVFCVFVLLSCACPICVFVHVNSVHFEQILYFGHEHTDTLYLCGSSFHR